MCFSKGGYSSLSVCCVCSMTLVVEVAVMDTDLKIENDIGCYGSKGGYSSLSVVVVGSLSWIRL